MKKMVRIQNFILIVCLGFLISAQAQNPSWVMQQLPGSFPSNYHYAVGETGMIFVDDTSNIVYAFDINQGLWVSYNAQSNATWTGALADGNVAMVWSDSLVVAYSALTHSFSPVPNLGYLINGGAIHGCKENFAYVVAPANWYVFDAGDGQWHVYNYTPPGNPGAIIQGGVFGKKDYLFLHLGVLNDSPGTIAAYSIVTKSFDERNLDYISNPVMLDHGFTFHYYHSAGPFYGGAYSAYTGSFSMKNSTELISPQGPGYFREIVATQITYAFTMHERLSPEFYQALVVGL